MFAIFNPMPLRKARFALDMTTSEAGQFVYVTRKTWEAWEADELLGKPAPIAKVELFFSKLTSLGANRQRPEMVVVMLQDPQTKASIPIDVVAVDNFLGLEDGCIIKSMAINRGRPYVHRTRFDPTINPHVLDFCRRHKAL